jgi:hypothetical protein
LSFSCGHLKQGRKWLPKTGWASSDAARRTLLPGGAFYSAVDNCPPSKPTSYISVKVGNFQKQLNLPSILLKSTEKT